MLKICFEIELYSTFCILDQNKTQKEEGEGNFERNSLKSLEILELL